MWSNVKIYSFVIMLMVVFAYMFFDTLENKKLKMANKNLMEQNNALYEDSQRYRNLYTQSFSQLNECKHQTEKQNASIKEYENKLKESQKLLTVNKDKTTIKYIEREKLINTQSDELTATKQVVLTWLKQ